RKHRRDRRIVALRMPHCERCAGCARGGDELLRLVEGSRHWLLQQDRDAALEKRQRHITMLRGRHRDRDGIHLADDVAVIRPRRPLTSSVPSIASTATTALCFTAIVCPISSAAIASAMR